MPSPSPTDEPPAVPCPGGLYVVATPIGNLEDISLRALRILAGVDLIAAEDTRHTLRLLNHYRIRTPLISCHEHNERQRIPELLERIRSGQAIALVSDAGTPSVSDPGYRLVREAVAQFLPVFPIPGVSAVTTALSVAGLPTDAFVFLGFAPQKTGKRREWLEALADDPRTLIFYESPRRLAAFVDDLRHILGERPAVVAREMTKRHEEFIRGTLSQIAALLADRGEVKGECTLLVGGAPPADPVAAPDLAALLRTALERPDARIADISKTLAKQFRLSRKVVYAMALAIQQETGGAGRPRS